MSIKSDRWINSACTRPLYMVLEKTFEFSTEAVENKPVSQDAMRWSHPHETLEYLKANIELYNQRLASSPVTAFGIVSYNLPSLEQLETWKPMIEPFEPTQIRARTRFGTSAELEMYEKSGIQILTDHLGKNVQNVSWSKDKGLTINEKVISYGTSSYGYDVRCAEEFKIFTNVNSTVVDAMNFNEKSFVTISAVEKGYVVIPPNSYALAHTVETFHMPRDVMAICVGKSTYARIGCAINVTPIEPGFIGQIVIEIANQTPLPMKVYANMGIAQFIFFQGEECEVSYADRGGKYQGQSGITHAKG